ncbi:MAG: hypothetical protein WC693_01350 [Patescibacteria group bacterium]|jgi:uridine kinase
MDTEDEIKGIITKNNFKLLKKNLPEAGFFTEIKLILAGIGKRGTKLIGFFGGPASGKTTIVKKLVTALDSADYISVDDYVIGDREYRFKHLEGKNPISKYNQKIFEQKLQAITQLRKGQTMSVPTYYDQTGLGADAGEDNYRRRVGKVDYLIVEGDFDLLRKSDYCIYFHVPDNIRLDNRLRRDQLKRNSTKEKVRDNFLLRQKVQFYPHVLPIARKADMIVEVDAKGEPGNYKYNYSVYITK